MAHERDNRALLTPGEAADYLRRPTKTLANWRSAGIGPSFYKTGGQIRYEQADLDAWLATQRVTPAAR